MKQTGPMTFMVHKSGNTLLIRNREDLILPLGYQRALFEERRGNEDIIEEEKQKV